MPDKFPQLNTASEKYPDICAVRQIKDAMSSAQAVETCPGWLQSAVLYVTY